MKLSWIRIIIILIALVIGIIANAVEKNPNSFLEQAAELILRWQGVHVDFSTTDDKGEQSCKISKNG